MKTIRTITVVSLLLMAISLAAQTPCNWSAQTGSVVETCGTVGIGTTTPASGTTVHINSDNNEMLRLSRSGAGWSYLATYRGTTRQGLIGDLSSNGWGIWTDPGVPLMFMTNGGYSRMLIDSSGNVGIGTGTTAPSNKLHVFSATSADGLSIDGTNNPAVVLRSSGSVIGYGPAIVTQAQSYFTDSQVGDMAFRSELHNILLGRLSGNGPSTMMVTNNSVGINTAPSYTLDVVGTGHFTGNVGIGTTSPTFPLTVKGAVDTTFPGNPLLLKLESATTAGANIGPGVNFSGLYNSTQATVFAAISGVKENATAEDYGGRLVFGTRPNGSGAVDMTRMVITSGGRVGIGVTNPAASLDVNGDINVSGNINAKYQDVAEWVPASTTMSPGTVAILNTERRNEVMPSNRAYDTTVAGVVSAQPGLILGEAGNSKARIATTGRVKVRVDASSHPVKIGDLLVTSNKPGLAMVSEPLDLGGIKIHRPGTLIGKALEPLANGEGEILVLLSLQ